MVSAESSKNKLSLQTLEQVMGAKFTSEVFEKQEGNEKDRGDYFGSSEPPVTFFQHWSLIV